MTMPANNIPAPQDDEGLSPPELRLLVTDNLNPEHTTQKGPTVNWIVGQPHPFMPSMIVQAMFVSRNAVAVYVYSAGKNDGARDIVPMRRVRLAHQRMEPEVYAEEIEDSEAGKDPYVYSDDPDTEDPDGDEPDSTPVTEPPPAPTNGQPSP